MTDLQLFKNFYNQVKGRISCDFKTDEEETIVAIGGYYGIELKFVNEELEEW